MRKMGKFLGLIAFVAIIGFSMAACDNETTSGPDTQTPGQEGSQTPGHVCDWGEWHQTTAPTCTATGVETRICSINSSHRQTRPGAPALGCDWGDWVVTTPATETQGGIDTRTCTRCSVTQTRTTSPIGKPGHVHNWGNWIITTPATCTANGERRRVCTIDNTHIEIEPISALGHDMGPWLTITPPSLTAAGQERRVCQRANCSHYETHTIPQVNLAGKLNWIRNNAQSGDSFIIELNANESIGPQDFSGLTINNLTITLRSATARSITLSSNGPMFTIGSGVTLVLEDNITLRGRSVNTSSLIFIEGGTFNMKGGTISGNMINTSRNVSGGGVSILEGVFNMEGGTISGNTVSSTSLGFGGGVAIWNGTFNMKRGTISGNTSSHGGGGVYFRIGGTFNMVEGTILGNASPRGGGVYAGFLGAFNMEGGTISENTSSNSGGGVYLAAEVTFTMTGGIISGNRSTVRGGGVMVNRSASFTKSGNSIITGWENDTTNGNVVRDNSGTVLSNMGHAIMSFRQSVCGIFLVPFKHQENTSGVGHNLSFNGTTNPPTWSGNWDF